MTRSLVVVYLLGNDDKTRFRTMRREEETVTPRLLCSKRLIKIG